MDKDRLEKLDQRMTDMELRQLRVELHQEQQREAVDEIKDGQRQVLAQMVKMSEELARYRGLVGGILLIITCIGAFLKLFWQDLKRLAGG